MVNKNHHLFIKYQNLPAMCHALKEPYHAFFILNNPHKLYEVSLIYPHFTADATEAQRYEITY